MKRCRILFLFTLSVICEQAKFLFIKILPNKYKTSLKLFLNNCQSFKLFKNFNFMKNIDKCDISLPRISADY